MVVVLVLVAQCFAGGGAALGTGGGSIAVGIAVSMLGHIGLAADIAVVVAVAGLVGARFQNSTATIVTDVILIVGSILMLAHIGLAAVAVADMVVVLVLVAQSGVFNLAGVGYIATLALSGLRGIAFAGGVVIGDVVLKLVTQHGDLFLGSQRLAAALTMATGGQTGFGTSGFLPSIRYFLVAQRRNFLVAAEVIAAVVTQNASGVANGVTAGLHRSFFGGVGVAADGDGGGNLFSISRRFVLRIVDFPNGKGNAIFARLQILGNIEGHNTKHAGIDTVVIAGPHQIGANVHIQVLILALIVHPSQLAFFSVPLDAAVTIRSDRKISKTGVLFYGQSNFGGLAGADHCGISSDHQGRSRFGFGGDYHIAHEHHKHCDDQHNTNRLFHRVCLLFFIHSSGPDSVKWMEKILISSLWGIIRYFIYYSFFCIFRQPPIVAQKKSLCWKLVAIAVAISPYKSMRSTQRAPEQYSGA